MSKPSKYYDFLFKQAVDRTLDMRNSDNCIHYKDVLIMLAHYTSDYEKVFENHVVKHVDEAMMHLSVAEDIEGNKMSESDAYNSLKNIVPNPSTDDINPFDDLLD